jgi:hypothetical protein
MSGETLEQKLQRLQFLRRRIDAEIAKLAEQTGRKIRRRDYIPPCGTEQAYQRHRYYKQDADEACKAAHRLHERARAQRARAS